MKDCLKNYKGGILGISLLLFLIGITVYTILYIPAKERLEWNNPFYWINYPKNAAPSWVNYFLMPFQAQLPEHKIYSKNDAIVSSYTEADFKEVNHTFSYDFMYGDFPSGFSIPFTLEFGEIPPAVEISVKRPDGLEFVLYYKSLDSVPIASNDIQTQLSNASSQQHELSQRIYSSSKEVTDSLIEYENLFNFSISDLPAEKIIFSKTDSNIPLNGPYQFIFTTYAFDSDTILKEINLIIEGKVFGLLGTDEFRRDITFGIMIGTPVALFIGVAVASTATTIGLFYGLIAGYKGGKTGTLMVIMIDIFLSIPTMVLFIILSLNYGNSLLFLIGLFVLFGWPGLALINRTFSVQIKNFPYVEASKLMGESDFRVVSRHIIPQLIPFTLANFALAVPAAILAEAALSFLGFGDPSFPTWGQMLQDAHFSSAEILGYWWWILAPGLMISITSVAFILIGRSLEHRAKLNKKQ
jgi:peptide/nickel transport system permease protein